MGCDFHQGKLMAMDTPKELKAKLGKLDFPYTGPGRKRKLIMVLRPRDVSVYCPADDGLSWF
jgi:hypothetical protein